MDFEHVTRQIELSHLSYDVCVNINGITIPVKDIKPIAKYVKDAEQNINNDTLTITLKMTVNEFQWYTFNNILSHADVDFDELCNLLSQANETFTDYEISHKIEKLVDKFVKQVAPQSREVWQRLTGKPDYNLYIFRNRRLPYFTLEAKDWSRANIDVSQGNYPTAILKGLAAELPGNDLVCTDDDSMVVKNNNYLEWSVLPPEEYEDVEQCAKHIVLMHKLNLQEQALEFFMKLLLSPYHCHVVKSKQLWELYKPLMAQNKTLNEILKYCCYYAMYIMRQEETLMYNNVRDDYRVLFSLEEAHALPTFTNAHIERNPYIQQLSNDKRVCHTIPFYVHGKRAINDRVTFDRRFHLATGGCLKGVDMQEINAAVTGSILIPCVHRSPLEDGFEDVDWERNRVGITTPYPFMTDNPENNEEYQFLNYLEYYYPGYASLTDADYKAQVLNIEEDEAPDEVEYEDDEAEEVTEVTTEQVVKTDRDDQSKQKIEYNQLSDIDISITTRDLDIFITNAKKLYEQIRDNCAHRGEVYLKEIKTISQTKYKIYGPGLPRPIDVFRVSISPAKMVKNFHLHCVKMYYDNNVTIFRSCLSALLSGVNESYTWFSCNKLPLDVLLKYAQRGISIVMNANEREATIKYLKTNISSERWMRALKAMGVAPKDMFACVTEKHMFFRPGIYKCGVRMTLREFEREFNDKFTQSLVTPYPKTEFEFGSLPIKNNTTLSPPDFATLAVAVSSLNW